MNNVTSRYNIALLFGCEALTRTASIIILTTMALTGKGLAASDWLATLPLALVSVATMCTTIPAARMMQRWGRKLGFALGTGVGASGALVCFVAVMANHFWGLCLGALGLGVANGFATYYRFAAAEVADDAFRSRAISLVMGGGLSPP